MTKLKAPAEGDRTDLGGKLPQYDAFAQFVYRELVNNNLTWVRIADPKAEKLDDILFSTKNQIHAYQIKWSNREPPNPISYNEFKTLTLECLSGWKALKIEHASESKKVIAHLLTNRPISNHDSIKVGDERIGSFSEFYKDAWVSLKLQKEITNKWLPVVNELLDKTNLSPAEFYDFIEHFEFHPQFVPQEFKIRNLGISRQEEDLIHLSRFLFEEVANKEKVVHYTYHELIKGLGRDWQDRFRTTFNHELVVDRSNYRPIIATLDELDKKLNAYEGGYIFLIGGPGTGKSTLLTDWAKKREESIIRYYAFDFTNPSSLLNDHERGEAVNLFFDIVFQIKQAKIQEVDVQPYKDLTHLKKAFEKQLDALGNIYSSYGKKTVIIVDGLDHIPREYTKTSNSLLAHLPKPSALPKGVYILLGSQSYDLDDLKEEIKEEFKNPNRVVKISSLGKNDVFKHIDSGTLSGLLTDEQKLILFEKSQGHPLYLSYLMQKISQGENITELVNSFDVIDGDIGTYYRKIWGPISNNESLVNLLGLISRINGSVSAQFIHEWDFDAQTLVDFRKNARFLFDESYSGWSFFHNSFRQFLIQNTALDPLTNDFTEERNKNYHKKLAELYSKSLIERRWKNAYHLYMAGEYEKFLSAATPAEFVDQFLNFRPSEEIRRDIKLGIEIAKQTHNAYLLTRYLFSFAELETRLFNIAPASLVKEFLDLGEAAIAKNYVRSGKTLNTQKSFALKAAGLLLDHDDKVEASIIFNIAEPDYISDNGITIPDTHRYEDERDTLEEWAKTASYFYSASEILAKINNITFLAEKDHRGYEDDESDLRNRLLVRLGESLCTQKKWEDLELLLSEIELSDTYEASIYYYLVKEAIEECLLEKSTDEALKWLSVLLKIFPKEKADPTERIHSADIIYKVTGDTARVKEWIAHIPQPPVPKLERFLSEGSLEPFIAKIKLNKLLHLCGMGASITEAVPTGASESDEEVVVEFERMLWLITQILSEGLGGNRSTIGKIKARVTPLVRFYSKDISHRNLNWSILTKSKAEYFDFLIYSVSSLGYKELNDLGDFFLEEFIQVPRFWTTTVQRKIILALLDNGFDSEKVKNHLVYIESFMLNGHDISGRIDECIGQAKAWISLSEKTLGKKWIQQAIKESLGVGYRKDYQFSSWIQWLQKINEVDENQAQERILWFLSHLRHIEETTEGSAFAYAAEELLQATFKWNFSAGRQQLEWQLDNGLVGFDDGLLAFIKNFLERSRTSEELRLIIKLYTDIFLYTSTNASGEVVRKYLEKGFEFEGSSFLKDQLPWLVTTINIRTVGRFNLFSAIQNFCFSKKINIKEYVPDFTVPQNPDRHSNNDGQNTLSVKENYETLRENEVLERVTDFHSFKDLLQKEDKANSYFKWDKVIEKILPQCSIGEILELSDTWSSGRRDSDFFAKLSEYALQLNNKEVAEKLAERAISASSDYGWIKWYDGGSRITAFLALKNVRPDLATSKAFQFLSHDALNYSDPASLCQQLEYILPTITFSYDISSAWDEVFGHLTRLMSTSSPITTLPELTKQDRSIVEDFFDLLAYLTKNPISFISKGAQALWATFITSGGGYAHDRLKQLYNGNDKDHEVLIHILMRVHARGEMDILNLYIDELTTLSTSNNYEVRRYSSKILNRLNRDLPSPTKRKPPGIYNLHIKDFANHEFGAKQVSPNQHVNASNPDELIRPYHWGIDILRDKTGIEKSNLIYRMVALMKTIDNQAKWTSEYEKKFSSYLRAINLKYPYPRPIAVTAKRAFMHLITELIDSGLLETSDIRGFFETHDHSVDLFNVIPKPSFIPKLTSGNRSYLPTDWVDKIEENDRLGEALIEFKEGYFVIAEFTEIKNLAWGAPTEIYMSQLSDRQATTLGDKFFFASAFNILSSDYYTSSLKGENFVVVREHLYDQFDLKSRWIALHPNLARYLGWTPDTSKLFGWKDSDGKSMVYSIFWSEGNTDMSPPHHEYEVGSGWFVVASQEAIRSIQDIESDLVLHKEVKRFQWDDSKYLEKEYDAIVELKE